MSRISVLVFPPSNSLSPSTSTPIPPATNPSTLDRSSSSTSTSTLTPTPYDFALHAESHRSRFPVNPFRKPFSLILTPNSTTFTPYKTFPHTPLLKIHIATTKDSRLIPKTTKIATTIPTSSTPEEWLTTLLTELQRAQIVQRFSVAKFHQFALDTLQKMPPPAARRMSSGTTELDYLALLSCNAEVKKMLGPEPEGDDGDGDGRGMGQGRTVCGFRISTSGRTAALTNRNPSSEVSWRREDDPYGGLM